MIENLKTKNITLIPTTFRSTETFKVPITPKYFFCDLCDSNYAGYTTRHLFQRVADHRYSAIGRHLRDAHWNIDLLNESQFRTLKICSTKWDCLVYEMLYIRTIRPNLNTQIDSCMYSA